MSIESELMEFLSNNVAGITYDETGTTGNIFDNVMPSSPDKAVMVENTGGMPQDMRRTAYNDPSIRILVRGTQDPRVAKGLARDITGAIGTFGGDSFIIGGIPVVKCQAIQSNPVSIGQDDNNRHRFSINFELRIKGE